MFEIISFKILKNLSYNFILACNSWSKTIRYRFCRFVCKHQVHSLCPQKKSTTKPMSNKKQKNTLPHTNGIVVKCFIFQRRIKMRFPSSLLRW